MYTFPFEHSQFPETKFRLRQFTTKQMFDVMQAMPLEKMTSDDAYRFFEWCVEDWTNAPTIRPGHLIKDFDKERFDDVHPLAVLLAVQHAILCSHLSEDEIKNLGTQSK